MQIEIWIKITIIVSIIPEISISANPIKQLQLSSKPFRNWSYDVIQMIINSKHILTQSQVLRSTDHFPPHHLWFSHKFYFKRNKTFCSVRFQETFDLFWTPVSEEAVQEATFSLRLSEADYQMSSKLTLHTRRCNWILYWLLQSHTFFYKCNNTW